MVMEMEMSKTYQYRKVMKPMLERKRRARINKCLDDLKDLMVECLTQEGEHVTRLEKADILELTVEHMKKLKRRGTLTLGSRQAPSSSDCFRSGYVHAADQISKVLASTPGVDVELGTKLMTYLGQRLNDIQSINVDRINSPPITPTPPCSFNVSFNCTPAWSSPHQPNSEYCDRKPLELKHSVMDLSKDSVWRPW